MGTINGTSAGNVAATGTFTIPLMKKVGYPPRSAGAIEAAASTGGQIMPPVMGAGVFIMAEVTGIPYTDLMVAAVLPALLYFIAVYFMVDNEAQRLNMKGLRPRSCRRSPRCCAAPPVRAAGHPHRRPGLGLLGDPLRHHGAGLGAGGVAGCTPTRAWGRATCSTPCTRAPRARSS
jgi:hypothetical protein